MCLCGQQEEQVPHATSEPTVDVEVEVELSETQATPHVDPLLSKAEILDTEGDKEV